MLQLTETALKKVKREMDKDPEKEFVRIFVSPGWCSTAVVNVTLDESTKENHVTMEAEGIKFLIHKDQVSTFDDQALDFLETYFGMGNFLLKEIE